MESLFSDTKSSFLCVLSPFTWSQVYLSFGELGFGGGWQWCFWSSDRDSWVCHFTHFTSVIFSPHLLFSFPLSCSAPHHQPSTLSSVPDICFWMCGSPSRLVSGVCKYVWLIFINGSVLYISFLFLMAFTHHCVFVSCVCVPISSHFCIVFHNGHRPYLTFPFPTVYLQRLLLPLLHCCLQQFQTCVFKKSGVAWSCRA